MRRQAWLNFVPPPRFNFREMLRVLRAHEVEFIVVGGVCAALHGSPMVTGDLDVVHARTEGNLDRLQAALRELDAVYRVQRDRRLAPPRSALAGEGHQLLVGGHGSIDVLGAIGAGLDYAQLLPHTEEVDLGDGLVVRMLDLPTLIRTKRELGRPKDMLAVLHLEEVLDERRHRED
jgi:hypothetical protein